MLTKHKVGPLLLPPPLPKACRAGRLRVTSRERKSHLAVLILAAWSLTGRISWALTFRTEASPGPEPQSGGSFQERITTGAHRTWGSEPQGKAFKRTETRKGEPGLQQLISNLAEGGAAHTAAAQGGRTGKQGWAGGFLNEGPEAPLGKGQWDQVLNTASLTGGGTDSGSSVREEKQQTRKTTLLFYSMEHPPFNAVLNHTPKSPEKFLLINQ